MKHCLLPWFKAIKEAGGLAGLSQQIGDYNIFYQFIIALFTYIPYKPMYLYKMLSIGFDYLLAAVCAIMLVRQKGAPLFGKLFNITFAAVILLPTVAVNGALWGQCDSIYTFFLICSVYCLMEKRDITAFVMLGAALIFKFQTIFLLPFYFCYYFYTKRFSIVLFLIPIGMLWLSGIPAYVCGRSLLEPFTLYMAQTSTYKKMWMNTASFWQSLGFSYKHLSGYAVCFTLSVFGAALYAVLNGRIQLDTPKQLLEAAGWCIWTCCLFLPAMHERYTYPVDILLLLLVVLDIKYLPIFCTELLADMSFYGYYLFKLEINGYLLSIAAIAVWILFARIILREHESADTKSVASTAA